MDFNDARVVDSLCFQMRQADWPRSLNRARINSLFNGAPPYTDDEAEDNEIEVNVNELSGCVVAHDARAQFYNAFLTPGTFFKLTCEAGAKHKRGTYGKIATKEMNRIMKRSLPYLECCRSKFASDVLHGIAPAGWRDDQTWCPDPFGVEDVMVPAATLLTMRNLPFFAIYRSFTAAELIRLTSGARVDPAWNLPLVKSCIEFVDQQMMALQGNNWREIWSPERMGERVKGDGGFYAGDQVPTIDCWDFYYWNDDSHVQGWNRRMVLDAWSSPTQLDSGGSFSRKRGKIYEGEEANQFLYNPKKRKWAGQLSQIINWQFADLSAVAPFRYHTVRSLGFLLYDVCRLQNRLYSKFTEAQFEQLMMYFRVKSADDMQRALKVDLVSRGFIDDSIEFIKAADRYQVNAPLIDLGLKQNAYIINRNSSSFTSNPNTDQGKRELTATQWLGEANKVTSLVGSALNQAYLYQAGEYREIVRRFTLKHSRDAEVKAYQAACLKQGVPEKIVFNAECWDVEPERVVGAGNRSAEMAVAEWLMSHINLFDPEPQRLIKRTAALAITSDPALTDALVPDGPIVTDTIHDAQLAAGTLMQGMPLAMKSGVNHIEYVDTLMVSMATIIQRIEQTDQTGTPEQVIGLQNMAQHIAQHLEIIAQDPNEKARVKQYGDQLGKLMNLVKGYAQRLAEQQQQQQAAGGGDPETQAKIASMMQLSQAKAANLRESHGQRTAQRQVQFESKLRQEEAKTMQQLRHEAAQAQLKLEAEAKKQQLEIEKAQTDALSPPNE